MLTGVELHNASYSYENTPNGRDIVFHDPFRGTPLQPESVPTSIATQPHLRAGLNHLARLSNEHGHTITIAGANHSSDSVFDMAELIGLAGHHDAIFLEGIGHTSYHRDVVQEVGEGRTDVPDDFAADKYKALQLASINAARPRQKLVTYADIPGDGSAYEAALIRWGNLARSVAEQARTELNPETRKNLFRAALINIAGSTIFREWQMLCSIGNSLRTAEQQGRQIKHSLFLIGTEHTQTLPKKLELLRVANRAVELTMRNKGTPATIECEEFDFTTAVRDYRAPLRYF